MSASVRWYLRYNLSSVREALKERFPSTYVHVARPAVVLEFGQGYERIEVIPAFRKGTAADGNAKFEIPGVIGEWLESSPESHLKYVTGINSRPTIKSGAKGLARLTKAWKYYRNVPISSFYLEMRAAAYMATQKSVIYPLDVSYFLNSLQHNDLAAMNDPTGSTGRIIACSSDANFREARSRLDTAVRRTAWAIHYDKNGQTEKAFEQWDLLFAGKFPSCY